MSRPKLNFVVLDPGSGKARPGAIVSFYSANTTSLVTLYADDDVSTLMNPVTANGLGQVAVRINPGIYDISMTWNGTQPTLVEDVLAWTPEEAVLTEEGDLIIGGGTGAVRLPIGANGEVLTVKNGLPDWDLLGSGRGGIPTGPEGSIITFQADGDLETLPPGPQDYILAIAGGKPAWVTSLLPPGTTLPINTKGDLVVGGTTGTPARLGIGTELQLLTVVSGTPAWVTPATVTVPEGRGIGQYQMDTPGGVITLTPYKGNQIWIDTQLRTIPDAGLTLTLLGSEVVGTVYYVYARWNGTNIVLEHSPTGYTVTGGYAHMTGDSTRALVGFAQWQVSNIGGTTGWQNHPRQRLAASYHNRRPRSLQAFLSGSTTVEQPTAPYVEFSATLRMEMLTWESDLVMFSAGGILHMNMPGSIIHVVAMVDAVPGSIEAVYNAFTTGAIGSVTASGSIVPDEGVHVFQLVGYTPPVGAIATLHGGQFGAMGSIINA